MHDATTRPRRTFATFGAFLFRYREALFPFACLSVFIPGSAIVERPLVAVLVGLAIALMGQCIRVLTIGLEYIIRGGRDRRVYAEQLVTSGVYAHCRNPMCVGNLFILTGVAVGSNSWTCVLIAVPLFTLAYMAIVAAEEDFLRGKFGMAFEQYCADVSRWIPRWEGLVNTFQRAHFDWRRVIVKEYGTPFGWILGFSVLTLWHLWRLGEIARRDEIVQLVTAVVIAALVLRLRVRYLKKSRRLAAD